MSKQPYHRSGFYALMRQSEDGKLDDVIEAEGRAWLQAVVDDLGGNLSEQQRTVLELASRTRYLLGVVDAFLAEKGEWAVIHKRDRRLHTIVHDRMRLSNALAKYMDMLGLEKREPPAEDLTAYLESKRGNGGNDSEG